MNRSLHRALFLCGTLFYTLPAPQGRADDAAVVALAKAEYRQSVSRFVDLSYVAQYHWEQHTGPPAPPDSITDYRLEYERTGPRIARSCRSTSATGDVVMDEVVLFDGRVFEHSWLQRDRTGQVVRGPVAARQYEMPPGFRNLPAPESLMGQNLWGGPWGVTDWLDQAESLGSEEVAGRRCLKFDLGRHARYPEGPGPQAHTVVWLDPEFGHLPRRILTEVADNPADFRDLTVDEFRPVSVPDSAETGWLASRGRSRNPRTQFSLEVTEASATPKAFTIALPAGVTVTDLTKTKAQRAGLTATSVARPNQPATPSRNSEPTLAAPQTATPATVPHKSARPRSGIGGYAVGLAVCSLALLATAVWLARR
jgi:hypothetical protein